MTESHAETGTLPLTAAEFARLMDGLAWRGDALAVAVSGGPDSMALTLLLRDWTAARQRRLMAFTVDHALRPESLAEAQQVARWMGMHGIAHEILRWEHPPLQGAIQRRARTARYALLAAACRRHGMTALALAHQQEDQAETVLMRLAKGTGVDGLAGMRAVNFMRCGDEFNDGRGSGSSIDADDSIAARESNIALLRPLLSVPKARLIAVCALRGQDYIRDPGNEAPYFARGRLRRAAEVLAAEGMDEARLGGLAARAASASTALTEYTDRLLARAARYDDAGYAELALDLTRAEPEEIQMRALAVLLMRIGGGAYAPKHAALTDLLQVLQAGNMPRRTLHGCEIAAHGGRCRIIREYAAIKDRRSILPGQTLLWDYRFRVALLPDAPEDLTIAPLGFMPHPELDRIAPGLRRRIPIGRVRAVLPALWRTARLHAVPAYDSIVTGAPVTY